MSKASNRPSDDAAPAAADTPPKRYCGIVRPIADMGTYSAKHWREVHNVISEAIEPLGFTLRLVSESDAAGVILTEIVSNLYDDEIVIVDVSGRNPNVMFELGMRLAFEKPAIIVMDDDTPFSFDISPVKHIRYPRTLRYADIIRFQSDLSLAVTATLDMSPDKKNYLQQFGPIKITELGQQSVDLNVMTQEIQDIKRLLASAVNRAEFLSYNPLSDGFAPYSDNDLTSSLKIDIPEELHDILIRQALNHATIHNIDQEKDSLRFTIRGRYPSEVSDTRNTLRALAREIRLANGLN